MRVSFLGVCVQVSFGKQEMEHGNVMVTFPLLVCGWTRKSRAHRQVVSFAEDTLTFGGDAGWRKEEEGASPGRIEVSCHTTSCCEMRTFAFSLHGHSDIQRRREIFRCRDPPSAAYVNAAGRLTLRAHARPFSSPQSAPFSYKR